MPSLALLQFVRIINFLLKLCQHAIWCLCVHELKEMFERVQDLIWDKALLSWPWKVSCIPTRPTRPRGLGGNCHYIITSKSFGHCHSLLPKSNIWKPNCQSGAPYRTLPFQPSLKILELGRWEWQWQTLQLIMIRQQLGSKNIYRTGLRLIVE